MFWKYPKILRVLRIAIPLLLTLLWLGFIFGNSLKDAQASSEQSSQVQEIVNNVASSVGVKEPISESTVRNWRILPNFSFSEVCSVLTSGHSDSLPYVPADASISFGFSSRFPSAFFWQASTNFYRPFLADVRQTFPTF